MYYKILVVHSILVGSIKKHTVRRIFMIEINNLKNIKVCPLDLVLKLV